MPLVPIAIQVHQSQNTETDLDDLVSVQINQKFLLIFAFQFYRLYQFTQYSDHQNIHSLSFD